MRDDTPGTCMVIDDELANVLDQVCEIYGLSDREEAMNWLVKSNLNGSLKKMIAGSHKPKLTVIKGGKK